MPRLLLSFAFALAAAPLFWGASRAAMHCDELNVLRHITYLAAGDLGHSTRPGLLWLALLPLALIDDPAHVLWAGRALAALASLGTLILVARLAAKGDERLGPWRAAGAMLLLGTSMDWQGHAFELRTDTFVVPLSLVVMDLLWRESPSRRQCVLAGVLFAAMGLISQKSIYQAGGIALGTVVWDLASGQLPLRTRLRQAVIAGGVATVLIAAWYAGMGLLTGRGASYVGANLQSAARTAWAAHPGLDEQLRTLGEAAGLAPVLWVAWPLGVVLAIPRRLRAPRVLASATVGLTLLSTLTIHRGFFNYFVANLEPYLALAGGHAAVSLAGPWMGRWRMAGQAAVLATVAVLGTWFARAPARALWATSMEPQRRLLADVRELFPEPVPYWDMLGTVPGYSEVSFLGTGASRESFRRNRGKNPFITLARQKKPHFFIREYMSRERYFQPTERRWIWRHYLPMRPNLYVHGLRVRTGEGPREDEVLLDGTYTVWFRGGWTGTALLDGEPVRHEEARTLTAGPHTLEASPTEGQGELWLILGRDRVPRTAEDGEQRDFSTTPLLNRSRFQQYDGRGKEGDLLTPPEDPTLTEKSAAVRARQHQKWQRDRARALSK